MTPTLKSLACCAALGATVLAAPAARADMVLGCQEVGPANIVSCPGTVNAPPNPGSTFYGDTFTAPTATITGTSFGFYDDFVFTIGSGSVDSLTSSINLGALQQISDLQVRLYSLSGNTLPVLGTPAGGAIDAWSSSITYAPGLTGMQAVLQPTTLSSGTYVLEVRGNVTGTSGGAYSGVLNLTPVPLPAGLPLLLSGVSMLGAWIGRRRTA
jgi:hypothetical protein